VNDLRRIAAASMIGTTLEYFDFAVYSALSAIVFNRIFFPTFDPTVGTILAFATFAVGYLSRPLGGLIFGRLGDRRGRRLVLTATLTLMGLSTLLIGLLPTYHTAGVISPALLVTLRFVQGMALGGEWAGAVLLSLEHGSAAHRGRDASWANMGPALGTLLATGLVALITLVQSADSFQSWGWRIPFLLSAALVGFGLWVRSGVDETPPFLKLRARRAVVDAPIREALRLYWRRLLIAAGARIGPDVQYSMLAVFTLTYLTKSLHQPLALALTAVFVGGACNALAVPCFGALSDRFGRRPVYGGGVVLGLGWALLYFRLLDSLNLALILVAVVSGFLIHAMMYGPQAAFITEQFPTKVRYASSSLAYTTVGIVGGGPAPLIFTALMRSHGTTAVSAYMAAVLGVSAAVILIARETSRLPLE